MRATAVANCQCTFTTAAFRFCCHAATSLRQLDAANIDVYCSPDPLAYAFEPQRGQMIESARRKKK